MTKLDSFIDIVNSEFDEDRLTFQRSVPTFHPESAVEAAHFFTLANREKQALFIAGFGNNIEPDGDDFKDIFAIKTDRLNQVYEVEVDDFFIKVGAGYPLKEINNQLKPDKLWLPHADLPYVGSVGGALACGLTSLYQMHDFPLKKYFIQAEIVTPAGEVITPGSTCFKSVSGYDIVRIFAGSWGLLGMIVSATFRVMPENGAEDYGAITLQALSHKGLKDSLDPANDSTDAVYAKKIKSKFDKNSILPVLF